MTEHRPIKPPRDREEDKSSLLERASGAFGLSDLGAAPMPRSFDDVPMKRARPLRKPAKEATPAPAEEPVQQHVPVAQDTAEASLPVPAQEPAPPPAVIEGSANAIALGGEAVDVDFNPKRKHKRPPTVRTYSSDFPPIPTVCTFKIFLLDPLTDLCVKSFR